MKISDRVMHINGIDVADDGWSVFYKARDMRAAGIDVTMLSIGDHDTRTADFIISHMTEAARSGNTRYAAVNGAPALRDAIAARVTAQTNVPTTADNVFVANGGQGALFAAMMAATDPGQKVGIIDPYYATYPATVRAASCETVSIPALPENGFQPSPMAILDGTRDAHALLINSPNNPTGAVYEIETLGGIRHACLENDLWLLSDEVYDTQVHNGSHISPRTLPDMAARTLVLGSLSKSHVMTGFRLGWCVGPEDFIARLTDLTNATTYGAPGFIQDAAVAALTDGAQFEAEVAALYTRRRDLAVAAFDGHNILSLSPPDGAMYVMVDVRQTGLSGLEFAHRLLDEAHIGVMPGESFGTAAAGHIRIALTIPDDELADALGRIADFAAALAEAA